MILRTLTILTFPLFSFSASTLRQKFKEINSDEDKTVSPAEFVSWFNYQDIEYLKKNARDHFSMFDKNKSALKYLVYAHKPKKCLDAWYTTTHKLSSIFMMLNRSVKNPTQFVKYF